MSSRFKCFAIICVLTLPGFLFINTAQTPQSARVPASKTQPAATPSPEAAPDYSQEAFVIEHLNTTVRFEKDGTGTRDITMRVKVINEAGVQGFGQLIFPYSSASENLDIESVSVRKSDGSVVTTPPSAMQDLTAPVSREAPVYTDLRQKHVTVPGLRPGDVLQYHAIWHVHTPLARNQFWLEHEFLGKKVIVLDEQLLVDIPIERPAKFKNQPEFTPTIKEQGARRLYHWTFSNLKREEKKPNDSPAKKTDEDDEPKSPAVQMSTFQNWAEVGQWYADLQRDRLAPDDKIIRGRETDKAKIEALYEFVAKNFRYVSLSLGQGRYQPHAASEVFANEYGDCKDKHTLLASMLMAVGFQAYPALMNSGRKIDVDVPSPAQFDHVITAAQLGGETLWLDTTTEVAPFRLLAPPLRDKKALVVPINAPANLQTTPAEPPFLSTEIVEVTGEVNELGKLTGHAHLILRGDSELLFRILFRKTPKSEWDSLKYYLKMITGSYGLTVTELKSGEPAALEKPFEVEYDFVDNDFLNWANRTDTISLPMPKFHLTEVDADRQEGSKPLELGAPIDITYRLKLTLPAKYKTRIPVPVKVNRDYAQYSSSYSIQGNTVTAERKLHLNQHEIPALRTQDYIAFVGASQADENQTVAVESETSGTPTIPETVKTEELMQAATAAAENDDFILVEQLLKRVLEKEPKHKEARRQLGLALFNMGKMDEAAKVLTEQVKINPFDNFAYNMLGRVYTAKGNYQEAETAFRKQLEITPLNKETRSNLGLMLVEARKFKEAVPELEQAISLNPDNEMLFVNLGRAYLNVGETTKATEAFDKAIKLDPSALIYNDVAYYLALSNVQLDKAQQYAESAVTTTAAQLRNIELTNAKWSDIEGVSSIGAYWDTLGWVFFQKGDLDSAERYVGAAWSLTLLGEAGSHLATIMEKRGKTAEALHLYSLAAAADDNVPEAIAGVNRLAAKGKVDDEIKKALGEMQTMRTIRFNSPVKSSAQSKEAKFFVALVPGPGRKAQVAEIKFIEGDDKLKPLGNALKDANFSFVFPDEKATRIIRKGTLFCVPNTGDCSFIMLSPGAFSPD